MEPPVDHVLVCGLGKVGFSILELLHSLGEPVVVIARDVDPDWARRAEKMAVRLLLQDMRDEEVLRDAGIETARAVIAATNDDLANLEVALDARRLAPHAAVVLRVHDTTLAERVRRDLPVSGVLNSAELSAPAFVAAALGDNFVRAFDVESAFVHIITLTAGKDGPQPGETLAEMAARLNVVPVALRSSTGGGSGMFTLDRCLAEGDEVVAAAACAALPELVCPGGILPRRARPDAGPSGVRRRRLWVRPRIAPLALAARMWRGSPTSLRYAILAVHAIIALSIVVYHFALRLNWVDAFYFTVTTVTTTGFGDITLLGAPAWLKLFGCLLMLTGAALLVIAYGIVASQLISLRLETLVGEKRTGLSDHVVIIGMGKLGAHVAARLHELGVPVLAVEHPTDSPGMIQLHEDIPVLRSGAGEQHLMEQAGVARARALVATTGDDMVNLRSAHEAEQLNPQIRTVVRLFYSSLAGKLGSRVLGVDQPLNPSETAAATFAACALAPDVLQGFTLDGRLLVLRWLDVACLPGCVGKTVADVRSALRVQPLLRRPEGTETLQVLRAGDVVARSDRLVVLEEYRPSERTTAACMPVALGNTA